jgi:hypothetical protein
LIGNKTGVRSYAYDYTAQGVGCYIRTFVGELVNNSTELDLELGTDYNIKSITWERLTSSGYSPLQTINSIQGLDFSYRDNAPQHGLNTYRSKLELMNGTVIYSDPITLYYANEPYFVYPNPVAQYHNVTIINNSPAVTQLQVFNSVGMKIFEQTLGDFSNPISTNRLGKGIYLFRVLKDGQLEQTLKVIVY